MFIEILNMISSGIRSVVNAIDIELFSVGSVSITLWEIILGLFVVGLIFSFFLAPRMGSGLQVIGNLNSLKGNRNGK